MSHILGVDVSHYEPAVDWVKAKSGGVAWMFTKATEGLSHVDNSLAQHTASAHTAGVLVGSYHFFHAKVDGKKQAELYLDHIRGLPRDLPPCLDWEGGSADGQSSLHQQAEAFKWLSMVERVTGRTPIIYGGESFLRGLQLPNIFVRYPLWVAHYGVGETGLRVPHPWQRYTMWQYTDAETVQGLQHGHHVDANWFNGTMDELKALAS